MTDEELQELDEQIRRNALKPESASADGQSVTQHSLIEQIKARDMLAARRPRTRWYPPIRVSAIQTPGPSDHS